MGIEYLIDDNGFEQARNGGDEKWWDSDNVQRIETKGFPNAEDSYKTFELFNSKYGVAIH